MRNAATLVPLLLLSVGCRQTLVSPAPTTNGLAPQLVCAEQLVTEVTVDGDALTPLPTALLRDTPHLVLPSLTLTRTGEPDGASVSGSTWSVDDTVSWIDAETMTFEVVPELLLEAGIYDLALTNPDGQAAGIPGALQAVPPPSLAGISPEVFCVDQHAQQLTLTGLSFLVVGDVLPEVAIGEQVYVPDAAEDCFALGGPVEGRSCTTLKVTVPVADLDPGVYDVTVTNPETAACRSTETVRVEVVPAPKLSSVVEELVCAEQVPNVFVLGGSDFLELDGVLPVVSFGTYSQEADSIGGTCVSLVVGDGRSCTELTIEVAPEQLPLGVLDVAVTNPAPAACRSGEAVTIEALPAPTVAGLVPEGVCNTITAAIPVSIEGAGFLFVEDRSPTVAIGSFDDYAVTADASSCVALTGPVAGEVCERLTVEVPAARYTTEGLEAVLVTNPAPAACDSRDDAVSLDIVGAPVITGVEPQTVCSGAELTISGVNLGSVQTVTLAGVDTDDSLDITPDPADISNTAIRVELPTNVPAGFYTVTVYSGLGCEDTWGVDEAPLEVTSVPLVFFVDPPVTYQPVAMQGRIYVSGVNGAIAEVWFIDPNGTRVDLVEGVDWTWSPDDPSRILTTLAADQPVGAYDVYVVDEVGCEASLDDGFTVKSELTVAFAEPGIVPPYGWTESFTPVEVKALADSELDLGASPPETNFADLPRLYLNPVDGGTGAIASELRAVTYQDQTVLDAVVQSGLPVGEYDLLVINPDQSIGYLTGPSDGQGAFRVTERAPPLVDIVLPGSTTWDYTALTLEVIGEHFRADAAVWLECRDAGTGAALGDQNATAVNLGAVDADGEARLLTATVNTTQYQGTSGVVCLVHVENTDNDTEAVYAAFSVSNPANKLTNWNTGEPLVEARRAPAAGVGRATRTSRYVYAIGGDDGDGNPTRSVEWARVDPFGSLQAWMRAYDPATPEANPYVTDVFLPEPRTLAASSQIGRYLYVVGGRDDQGAALDTVLRAQILDPLEAPRFDQLRVDVGDGVEGLTGGTWIYRVATLYDASDDDNPLGESLPSDPFVIRLPDFEELLVPTLTWNDPCEEGCTRSVAGYRIYRSPFADAGSASEEWLTDVEDPQALSFRDVGATVLGGRALPTGAIGQWESILLPSDGEDPNVGTSVGRVAPCAGIGLDPLHDRDDPGPAYLYVAGGLDGSGVVRSDVFRLTIAMTSEHDQDAVGWTKSTVTLPSARWQCRVFAASNDLHDNVDRPDTWMYFGPGFSNAGASSITTTTRVGRIAEGGELVDLVDLAASNDPPSHAGYAFASAGNKLYLIGGAGGGASSAVGAARLCGSGAPGCTGNDVPDVGNWQADTALPAARFLSGAAQESSVIFVIGGFESSTVPATRTVFWNNY